MVLPRVAGTINYLYKIPSAKLYLLELLWGTTVWFRWISATGLWGGICYCRLGYGYYYWTGLDCYWRCSNCWTSYYCCCWVCLCINLFFWSFSMCSSTGTCLVAKGLLFFYSSNPKTLKQIWFKSYIYCSIYEVIQYFFGEILIGMSLIILVIRFRIGSIDLA